VKWSNNLILTYLHQNIVLSNSYICHSFFRCHALICFSSIFPRGSVHTRTVVNSFPLEVNYILDRRIVFKYLYIMFSPTTITSERSIRMTCRSVSTCIIILIVSKQVNHDVKL